ncbi:MAG: ATP-binding protein [Actinomycetota bacterium]|nr:ATP-binding protein [Actinomycetota bacterium]MDQ5807819.1 ATP-binding protein [Actinomycetota bacterium]
MRCECDGSGFVVDEATNTARDCSCRARRRSEVKARRLEARVPRRYRHVAFEREPVANMSREIIQQVRAFTSDIDRNLDRGRGIWFTGRVGTGKTTLAMLVSKSAIDAGRSVAIYSLPRLLAFLREAIDSEVGVMQVVDDLSTVDLLHLDDLGAERATDWVLEQLYAIINARYEEQRSLVVTTNLDANELMEQVGPRIVSRLREMCGWPVHLDGDDRRDPARNYETTYMGELTGAQRGPAGT